MPSIRKGFLSLTSEEIQAVFTRFEFPDVSFTLTPKDFGLRLHKPWNKKRLIFLKEYDYITCCDNVTSFILEDGISLPLSSFRRGYEEA